MRNIVITSNNCIREYEFDTRIFTMCSFPDNKKITSEIKPKDNFYDLLSCLVEDFGYWMKYSDLRKSFSNPYYNGNGEVVHYVEANVRSPFL